MYTHFKIAAPTPWYIIIGKKLDKWFHIICMVVCTLLWNPMCFTCMTPANIASRSCDFRRPWSRCYCDHLYFFSTIHDQQPLQWFCLCSWQRQKDLFDSFGCLVLKENLYFEKTEKVFTKDNKFAVLQKKFLL